MIVDGDEHIVHFKDVHVFRPLPDSLILRFLCLQKMPFLKALSTLQLTVQLSAVLLTHQLLHSADALEKVMTWCQGLASDLELKPDAKSVVALKYGPYIA
jgi:hypothetical protein